MLDQLQPKLIVYKATTDKFTKIQEQIESFKATENCLGQLKPTFDLHEDDSTEIQQSHTATDELQPKLDMYTGMVDEGDLNSNLQNEACTAELPKVLYGNANNGRDNNIIKELIIEQDLIVESVENPNLNGVSVTEDGDESMDWTWISNI